MVVSTKQALILLGLGMLFILPLAVIKEGPETLLPRFNLVTIAAILIIVLPWINRMSFRDRAGRRH